MDYHKSYYLMFACTGIGILMWLLFQSSVVMLSVGIVVTCGGLLQAMVFFRCPHCKQSWNIKAGIPQYCPHCGKEIR